MVPLVDTPLARRTTRCSNSFRTWSGMAILIFGLVQNWIHSTWNDLAWPFDGCLPIVGELMTMRAEVLSHCASLIRCQLDNLIGIQLGHRVNKIDFTIMCEWVERRCSTNVVYSLQDEDGAKLRSCSKSREAREIPIPDVACTNTFTSAVCVLPDRIDIPT